MTKKELKTTGAELREVREYIGLSQEEMGAEIGVTERQIRRWEGFDPKSPDKKDARKFRRGDVLAYLYLMDQHEKAKADRI